MKSVIGNTKVLSGSNLTQDCHWPFLQQASPAWGLYLHFPHAQGTFYLASFTLGLKPIRSGLHSLALWSPKRLIIK